MADLIDTTEMYLKVVYEFLEEGITPLRARIVERLGQSGPTVSETVARIERDKLLVLGANREIELTDIGKVKAIAVMRKHRLAELLLYEVLKLDWSHVHEEACGWEHVMSEEVTQNIAEIFKDRLYDPYGNPVPAALDPERPLIIEVENSRGESPLQELFVNSVDSETPPDSEELDGSEKIANSPLMQLKVKIIRIGEPVQASPNLLEILKVCGVFPGEILTVTQDEAGNLRIRNCKGEEDLVLEESIGRHLYCVRA